tara:strand:+ start:84 stop:638 length:555 start_codon:yes stop_codon:yes gene_type:complete
MSSEIIFSVPLIRYKIENWDIAKKEIKNALPNLTENLLKEDIYTDYFNQNENLPSYSDTVLKIIEPYLRLLSQNSCVYITDMWFQTALKGMKHTCHNHGLGWSAIIYIDFDEQKHIATKFYSPFNDPFNNCIQSVIPKVKEGDMLIFPANLTHECLPNTTDTPRTIISFNLTNEKQSIKKVLFN